MLTPEVTEGTWAALCNPTSAVHGLVAEQEDQLAGLAYLVLHPTTGPRTRPATWKTSTPPSSGAAATLQTGSSRPSTHPTGSAPPAHPGVQRPGTLLIRHPRPSDIVFGKPALSLPEDSARCGRRRRLPRPIRCAAHKRRSPYLPASPVHWSTPERESQRQGRCNSLTKINAGLHGAAGASARRLADMTCLGARFDLACAHGPAGPVSRSPWSVAGSAGSINQYASRQYAKGVAERAPRCDRQRSWRSLRDRRTTGFPQIRAVRAVWRPFWLDGNACGQREGE